MLLNLSDSIFFGDDLPKHPGVFDLVTFDNSYPNSLLHLPHDGNNQTALTFVDCEQLPLLFPPV